MAKTKQKTVAEYERVRVLGREPGARVCGVCVERLTDDELGTLMEAVTEEIGRRLVPMVAKDWNEGKRIGKAWKPTRSRVTH